MLKYKKIFVDITTKEKKLQFFSNEITSKVKYRLVNEVQKKLRPDIRLAKCWRRVSAKATL